MFVGFAALWVLVAEIRGTLFRYCVVVLHKNSIYETPTTMASLCHIVTIDSELS